MCPVEIASDLSAWRAARVGDHGKHGGLLEGRSGAGDESNSRPWAANPHLRFVNGMVEKSAANAGVLFPLLTVAANGYAISAPVLGASGSTCISFYGRTGFASSLKKT